MLNIKRHQAFDMLSPSSNQLFVNYQHILAANYL